MKGPAAGVFQPGGVTQQQLWVVLARLSGASPRIWRRPETGRSAGVSRTEAVPPGSSAASSG